MEANKELAYGPDHRLHAFIDVNDVVLDLFFSWRTLEHFQWLDKSRGMALL